MKQRTIIVAALSLFLCESGFANAASLLIKNVNLIDGSGSPLQRNMDVLIDAGRIAKIAQARSIKAPVDANIVDGSGQFLIPGLWDMHVHWYDQRFLPLFVANGVTGVRQMWGMETHYAWRARENDPSFIGPKQVIASVILDGAPKVWPNSIEVTDAESGRQQVRLFRDKGADFIKVYNLLRRDVYFAITDESRKLGIAFAGHVPQTISLEEASDAGQKSMEHLIRIDYAVATDIEALRAQYARMRLSPEMLVTSQEDVIRGESAEKKAALFRKFVVNGTWQSPTLNVLRSNAYLRERAELDKDRMTYLPKQITQEWPWEKNPRAKAITDENQWKAMQFRFAYVQRLVGDMHKAGVKIIAGTDVLNPYCFPGFSLHDELELLVQAGLPPMAALQAATVNAAEYSGKSKDLGTVTEGKIADLVLLRSNPLENIRNTTKISSVVLNGVLHDRKALDAMLKQMQELANHGT